MKWTDRDVRILKRRHPKEPVEKIAIAMGRTAQSVRSKSIRLKLPSSGLNGSAGRPRSKPSLQVTKWTDTYTEIFSIACRLHERNVSIEVRSKWTSPKGTGRQEQFAIFRVYPRTIKARKELIRGES